MAKKQNAPIEPDSYAAALAALEDLQQRLEQNEVPIDELADQVAAANRLLRFCQARLRNIADQIQAQLSEDDE